jgi:hypothetical protein
MAQRRGVIRVHRLAPRSGGQWAAWSHSWPQLGVRQTVWRDDDIPKLVRQAFPSLAAAILSMRAKIERVDMARLAIMYLHGGVYADLDQELLSPALLHCIVALNRIVLPFEVGRLIGQSILISPPRRPFWRQLATRLVRGYNGSCYEPMNTGPDAITRVWNEESCSPVVRGVLLMDGLLDGPVVRHHITGSWRDDGSIARRNGGHGCAFRRARLALQSHVSTPETLAARHCSTVINFTRTFARRLGCIRAQT